MKQAHRERVVAKVMDLLDTVDQEPGVVHTLRISARKGRPSGTMTGKKNKMTFDDNGQSTEVEIEEEHHEEFGI